MTLYGESINVCPYGVLLYVHIVYHCMSIWCEYQCMSVW